MLHYSESSDLGRTTFGSVLFNGGFIPLVTMIISLYKNRDDLIKTIFNLQNALLIIFIAVGLSLI